MAYTDKWMEAKTKEVWDLFVKASRNTGLTPSAIEMEFLGTRTVMLHNFSKENIRKLKLLCSPHWRTLLKVLEIRRE